MTEPPLRLLTDHEQTLALERFARLQPFLEQGVSLTVLAQQYAMPLRTLQDWLARYRTSGLAGLVRKPRADRGQRRMVADLQHLIEGLALQRPAPSAAAIYRQAQRVARDHGWPMPSYQTIVTLIKQLPPALTTLAHDGEKAYADRYDLIYRREADHANECWQADHTPLDIVILDDHGRPSRPWLTAILDDYSRAIAGYYLSLQHPSAIHTALALRQAIWRKGDAHWRICGIPTIFYSDHGSDFTSKHLEQVCANLQIQLRFAHSARSKGKIERFFLTINQLFLCEQPGYSPAGGPAPQPSLTLPALEARLRTFLIETYLQRIHAEIAMAPQARWEQGAFLPRLPDSLDQLDLLLLTVAKTRRVQPDGIHFSGLRYMDPTLAAYVGEDVVIRYDPRDIAEIRVYYDQHFLCRAVCHEVAGTTLSLKEVIHARKRRRRLLKETLAERKAVVDRLIASQTGTGSAIADPPAGDLGTPLPRLKRYRND